MKLRHCLVAAGMTTSALAHAGTDEALFASDRFVQVTELARLVQESEADNSSVRARLVDALPPRLRECGSNAESTLVLRNYLWAMAILLDSPSLEDGSPVFDIIADDVLSADDKSLLANLYLSGYCAGDVGVLSDRLNTWCTRSKKDSLSLPDGFYQQLLSLAPYDGVRFAIIAMPDDSFGQGETASSILFMRELEMMVSTHATPDELSQAYFRALSSSEYWPLWRSVKGVRTRGYQKVSGQLKATLERFDGCHTYLSPSVVG